MFDEEELAAIRDAHERWADSELAPAVERFGERREVFHTDTKGTTVDRLYTPRDIAGMDYESDLGFPGEPPFTRGVYPTMHRGRLWTMRQYAGFGTATETNDRFRYLLDAGQTGLSLAFDLPTQMGYDSDDQLAAGEVGRSGVAIDTIDDMERVFEDIPLDEVSTSMTINAPAIVLLAMYIVVGDRQGVSRTDLRGTVQNDVLKEYIARNTYIYPPESSLRIVTDIFDFCADEMPSFNPISVSGYHIREAGSTAAQEIAFTIANGIEYVEAATEAGLAVDDFAPQVSFFFASHNNLLEEVAKFRAARRLWASIMTERFGAADPDSRKLKFHAQTAGSTLTAQQIDNNVARVAYQALAAVLGGAQSLHTNSKDEALSIPTEATAQTALRTQQILAHETGVADTVDPMAGSFAIESLTDELEATARELIQAVDDQGGMLEAIESEWVQREIQDVAFERQRAVESRERIVVGVNRFESDEEDVDIELESVSEDDQQRQRNRLASVRNDRDDEAVDAALESVRSRATGRENLMPAVIDAVDSRATVGEICDVLRDVYGTY